MLCKYLPLTFWYFFEFSGTLKSLYSSYFTLENDRVTRKAAVFNLLAWKHSGQTVPVRAPGLGMSCPGDAPLLETVGAQKPWPALEAPWFPAESQTWGSTRQSLRQPNTTRASSAWPCHSWGTCRTTRAQNPLLLSLPSVQQMIRIGAIMKYISAQEEEDQVSNQKYLVKKVIFQFLY